MAKVDEVYLNKLVGTLRDEFAPDRKLMRLFYDFYHQTHKITVPKGADLVYGAVGPDAIEATRGVFSGYPVVEVKMPRANETMLAKGNKMGQFLNAIFPAMEAEADEDTWDLTLFDALLSGVGFTKTLPAWGYWKDYPGRRSEQSDDEYIKETDAWKRKHRLPIAHRHVPSQGVLCRKTSAGLYEVIEEMDIPIYDLLERFDLPGLQERVGSQYKEDDLVTVLEYANRYEVIYAVEFGSVHNRTSKLATPHRNGSGGQLEIARRWRHGLGRVPYTMMRPLVASPGEGNSSSDGGASARYISLLYHMRFLIPYLDRLLSQKATGIRRFLWPKMVLRASPETASRRGRESTLKVDMANIEEVFLEFPGEELRFLTWQGNPPEIEEMYAAVRSTLDRLGPSPVTYGMAGSSDEAGYRFALASSAALAKYEPMARRVAAARKAQAELVILCAQQISETIEVLSQEGDWFEFNPAKDIPDDYAIQARLSLQKPPDLPSMVYMALAATQPRGPDREGLVSEDYARRNWLQDPDPLKTRQELDIQMLRRQLMPLVVEALKQDTGNYLSQEEQIALEDLEGAPPGLLEALAASGFPVPPGMGGPGSALGQPLGPAPGGPNMGMIPEAGEGLPPTPQRRPGSRVGKRPPGPRPGLRKPPVGGP